jgi:hypothetical protein
MLMKNYWIKTFRRLVAASVVAGSTALSSAACYAAVALDTASDPVYADGWQAGDNGGFGFTPWNWDAGYIYAGTNYTYNTPAFAQIDDGLQGGTHFSNPHNSIGRSWAMGNSMADDGAIHIGRGFDLDIGQTLRVVFDNPTRRVFFKGYFIRLNGDTGGTNGNICNQGYGCSHPTFPDGYPVPKNNLATFEYGTAGEWSLEDNVSTSLGVFDTDTSASGAVYTVSRLTTNQYIVKLDSLGGGNDFGPQQRLLMSGPEEVDWIEFVFFLANADTGQGFSDETPTLAEPQTDLYIRSMEIFDGIVPEPGTATMLVLAAGTLLGVAGRRRRED